MTNDDLEGRLREALHQEAERIKPHERRMEILAMAHDEKKTDETPRRWLVPGAAAASVILIAAVVWGVSNTGGNQQLTPAVSQGVTTTTPAPEPSPKGVPSQKTAPAPVPPPKASSNGSVAGATTQVTLPAYFIGANSPAGKQFGLYREFVRTAVPADATAAQKAKAAVAVAMNAQPFTNDEPYLQPWSGTSVTDVAVTPSLITITLSGPGASGFTADQTKLAVQQLVWTAQAAVGGTTPVKFVVASGSPELFGTYPTTQTYNRPAKDLQYEVLAPIWITAPARGQAFPAGKGVVAAGQSCAFEGTTQWELKKSGTNVKSGFTTASSGCPTRGTWQVKLGALASGSYTFRMYEVSMQDGTGIVAETSKAFTVK